ncbi:AGC kinase [Cardiosporidium cionae]|uniref:AGC kinase n=1 Tax=Cardiosporidium cionae TaxID=476202 RepID=A0ABQ7J9E7_9APIC|nr:AGC kinase [Cardiosporidium cionae]|eukprot:KAF8820628.1 AGC kinase [Cardiosporidium cionae]
MGLFKKLLQAKRQPSHSTRSLKQISKPELCIDNLLLLKTLGTGSFGRVFLTKFKDDPHSEPMAVKRLKKAVVIRQKQVDHIVSERKILSQVMHPFVVNLIGSFKDDRFLYIALEYVVGGEFFTYLRRIKRCNEEAARFYTAQVILIFDYLHSKNIIYRDEKDRVWRDLKPENLLIDSSGYLKLTDFGFAKVIEHRTFTLCGTPEYIAPEVLLNRGHGKPVDWWTLGILIYEMIVGYPPFFDEDPMGVYHKILNGKIVFPAFFPKYAKLLVRRFLSADLSKRYGNLRNGIDDIRNHKWFEDFPWDLLLGKSLAPPYKPRIKSLDDSSNFEAYPETVEQPMAVVGDDDPFNDW